MLVSLVTACTSLVCISFCQDESEFILLDDLVSGKTVVEGKSGNPVGYVSTGFVKSVEDNKNGDTVVTMEAENKKSFSSLDDGKYDHFAYVMVKKKTAQPSLQSVLNRNVGFFESFTFGGDPREFNSPGDFNSGPSFRFRTFLAIVPDLPSGVQHPLTPSQQKVSWKDLESGRLRVLGRLSEQLGTVMECHCRIANDRSSLVISTSKIKEKVFNRTHVIFKKLGCVVEWKYVETNLDEFDSVCYERVDCIAIPKLVRDALDIGGDATNDVRPTDFLVVKIPASINLPGYDIELPTSP